MKKFFGFLILIIFFSGIFVTVAITESIIAALLIFGGAIIMTAIIVLAVYLIDS